MDGFVSKFHVYFLKLVQTVYESVVAQELSTPEYGINRAIVFSNERIVKKKNGVTYMPVYYCMFLQNHAPDDAVILPALEPV